MFVTKAKSPERKKKSNQMIRTNMLVSSVLIPMGNTHPNHNPSIRYTNSKDQHRIKIMVLNGLKVRLFSYTISMTALGGEYGRCHGSLKVFGPIKYIR